MPSTIVISQRAGGTSIQFDRGKWSGSSSYVITDSTGAKLTAAGILADSAVVAKLFPTEYGGSGGAITDQGSYFSGLVTSPTFDLKMVDDGGFVWEATVNFASQTGDNGGATTDNKVEREVGFIAIEYSLSGEPVDIWRANTNVPPISGGSIADPGDNDIGGTKVDSAGEPISTFVNVARVTVRNVISGRPGSAGKPIIPLAYINRRNDANFSIGPYSFLKDTLLFTGCNISRVGPSTYEIVYSFSYDSKYHLRQIAKKNADTGQIECSKSTDTCTSSFTAVSTGETARARCVYWRQPFPGTATFTLLGMTTT